MKKILLLVVLSLVLFGCATTLRLNETITGEYSPLSPTETVTNPNMVLINGGTFRMGASANSTGVLTTVESFYISKYEVTVGEFRRFINSTGYTPTGDTYGYDVWLVVFPKTYYNKEATNSSWDNPYMEQDENHPVVLVSWYDAVEYCNWLSLQEDLTPAYKITYTDNKVDIEWNRAANGYRLPTEAEWEYACRAGSTTLYYYGDTPDVNTGWYQENSNVLTHPVGTMLPNAWGLYDMQGNVSEWVQDWYSNGVKLIKGISFFYPVDRGQSNHRYGIQSFRKGDNEIGFRIARR
jgi:formylglycine-generating enzyme required for sulfatase activity